MRERQSLVDEYHAAMEAERQLWHQVAGRGPTSPDFDQQLFDKWLAAVGRTTLASKAVREAFSDAPQRRG